MRVQNQQTFQINLSAEHIGIILEGLAELPFKQVSSLIRYLQQQMQNQLVQARAVDQSNEEEAKAAQVAGETKRVDDPALASVES